MRMIDADELIKCIPSEEYNSRFAIMNAPTIKTQAEIIRCKDCKHWHNSPTSDGYNSCEKDALIRHESFFCASGKLRGDSE